MIDRLRAARQRLARHAAGRLTGLTEPDAATGERWEAGQVWAHLAEFPAYWLAETARVVESGGASRGEPIPFGRTKADPGRLAAIERDRRQDPRALMRRVSDGIDAVIAALDRWSPDDLAARGSHATLGEMPAREILERFVAAHLEEHADQLDALAAGPAREGSVMERILAFTRGVQDRSATRLAASPVGTALLNDDYPLSHAHNFLRVEGPQPTLSPEAIDAEARRRLASEAGRSHLMVLVEDGATGDRVASGMRDLGWKAAPIVYMALTGEPSVTSPQKAELAEWAAVRPVVVAGLRSVRQTRDEEVVRQLTGRREATAAATHLRHVAAPAGGPYAASADLYSDGRTLQIESVMTVPEARNRGLGRAVVLEAARLARREGHDLIFLIADEEDWPKELYARLGFRPVGRSVEFGRPSAPG